jgi:hypothetical protein
MKQPKKEDRRQKTEDRSRFALIGDPDDPKTWLLPHHTPKMVVSPSGDTMDVDWLAMTDAVALLAGIHGNRVPVPPETIVETAKHLAEHYQEVKKPIPDALAVLI